MKRGYYVGDRVVCVRSYAPGAIVGDTGTVVKVYEDPDEAPLICWDDFRDCRHNANGEVPEGHGWFVFNSYIELCEPVDFGEFTPNMAPGFIDDLLGG